MDRRQQFIRTLLIAGWLAAAGSRSARGSTVLPMTIEELADAAGQVIDGVVASTASAWSDDHTTIYTTVRFVRVRYLKGRLADSRDTFELRVPGGRVGGVHLRLTGAPRFEIGQRWLLFLHPTYNVHPVVGISRGAFRIEPAADDGVRILTPAGASVVGIDHRGFVRTAAGPGATREPPRPIVGSVSRSVAGVVEQAAPAVAPLSYRAFLARIEPVLRRSRDYHLTAPAGRYTGHRVHAVPLGTRGRSDTAPSDASGGGASPARLRPIKFVTGDTDGR